MWKGWIIGRLKMRKFKFVSLFVIFLFLAQFSVLTVSAQTITFSHPGITDDNTQYEIYNGLGQLVIVGNTTAPVDLGINSGADLHILVTQNSINPFNDPWDFMLQFLYNNIWVFILLAFIFSFIIGLAGYMWGSGKRKGWSF